MKVKFTEDFVTYNSHNRRKVFIKQGEIVERIEMDDGRYLFKKKSGWGAAVDKDVLEGMYEIVDEIPQVECELN